jgi:hypothetical protein
MRIRFLLVCEGSSDRGLVPHLEALCVRAGAEEAMGEAPDLSRLPKPPGRKTEAKVTEALRHVGDVNLLFVHEDADARDAEEVRAQIQARISGMKKCPPCVCVVPVREMEAWLLAEEEKIRLVAGNPQGKEDLGLPPLRRIESALDAKKLLQDAFLKASGARGLRLQKTRNRFPELRSRLLYLLDIDGPVKALPAWQVLVDDINAAVAKLAKASGND